MGGIVEIVWMLDRDQVVDKAVDAEAILLPQRRERHLLQIVPAMAGGEEIGHTREQARRRPVPPSPQAL